MYCKCKTLIIFIHILSMTTCTCKSYDLTQGKKSHILSRYKKLISLLPHAYIFVLDFFS